MVVLNFPSRFEFIFGISMESLCSLILIRAVNRMMKACLFVILHNIQ